MAISRTAGATASLVSTNTTLAFAAATLTNGQSLVICVSIPGTTTVSGISDGSANVYSLKTSVTNASAIRSELWTCPITAATASRTITITFSGSTLASAAYEEYAGVTAFGNTNASTGSSRFPNHGVTTQDFGNWAVVGLAAATNSGDTFTAQDGTIAQSVVPALTTAATALVDNGNGQQADGILDCMARLSTSRSWASTGVELRSGNASANYIPSPQTASSTTVPTFKASPQLPSAILGVQLLVTTLPDGTIGVAYSQTITSDLGATFGTYNPTFWIVKGILPDGLSLNSSTGLVSGTPTTLGKSYFAVWCVDRFGLGQLFIFDISILPASGGSFTFIG